MKRLINIGVCILLVLMLFFPVFGDSLSSNGDGTASGSTSVTARVVVPSDMPQNDIAKDGESVKTGDSARPLVYVGLMVVSIATGVVLWKQKRISN